MDSKPTWKSEIALVAGLLAAILPVLMDKLPADSAWVAVLGAVMAAVTYIGGRQLRVASEVRSAAIIAASKAGPQSPSSDQG